MYNENILTIQGGYNKIVKKNGVIELKKLKEKYQLTWKQTAGVLGISEAWIGNWYSGASPRPIPRHYLRLIQIFLDDEKIFEKYRFDK